MDTLLTAPADLNAASALLWTWAVEFLPRLGGAMLLLVVGLLVAKWAGRLVSVAFRTTDRLDRTFAAAIAAAVRYGIVIIVVVAALGQLGIQTASILAALGAAGLAIGLALQGTLSNIAAGLMLLWLRPFRIGESIEAGDISGTVREIGLFVTLLDTADGLYRFVPNATLWNRPLVNFTRNGQRRLDVRITLGHGTNVPHARKIIADVIAGDARIMQRPAPKISVADITDTGTVISVLLWTRPSDYGDLQGDLLERMKVAVDAAGLPAPTRITQQLATPGTDVSS